MRAYPLRDSVGSSTDASGLPVNWGPKPELLPADAVFPAGATLGSRSTSADIGGTDRVELASKSNVRWPDGVYRQATSLAQYSGMPGNLADAAVLPTTANTVFVADLPLAEQPDATLEPTQRWRAGFDVAALKIRFYTCQLRKSDQANLNCTAAGDGSLALSTQGGIPLMRVASGYPAVLLDKLAQQRFWAEHAGTVFRGATDLPRTRYDQRLNLVAWNALRGALGMPAHSEPTAPVASGPFEWLSSFRFTNLSSYSMLTLSGDSSFVDSSGGYTVTRTRKLVSGGVEQQFGGSASYWTGSEWVDCPSYGTSTIVTPLRSVYCKVFVNEQVSSTTLSLGGRLMRDVVNDVRAYGAASLYASWAANPALFPQLASTAFPAGATLQYQVERATAVPSLRINALDDSTHIRVAPSPYLGQAASTWALAKTLEEMVPAYPGGLASGVVAGNNTLSLGYTASVGPDAAHPNQAEVRLALDANGNKARYFYTDDSLGGAVRNVTTALDSSYSIEMMNGVRVLKIAATPTSFDPSGGPILFAERSDGVWRADAVVLPAQPLTWTIRVNGIASKALRTALGLP